MAGGALVLSMAPERADYLSDLLPGFVALGAGMGLVFPTVSLTAMSDVAHDDSGLASGLMQTSHEIGAALGVAVMSASPPLWARRRPPRPVTRTALSLRRQSPASSRSWPS